MPGRLAAAFALLLSSSPAFASLAHAQAAEGGGDDATAPEDVRAREAFTLGSRAFEDRRWEDAVRYFERAYELSGRPALLYNLGAAYERMGARERGIDAFERYLEASPNAENRTEVEERLHNLRAGLDPPDAAAEDGNARESGNAESGSNAVDVDAGPGAAPWIVMGTGALAAGLGGVLMGLASAAKGRVESAPMGTYWDTVEGEAADASTFSIVGAILLGVGGAALVSGLVWLLVGDRDDAHRVVAILPGGVSVWGRF
jgi:tetratricopeptide (TPR) repeat protein